MFLCEDLKFIYFHPMKTGGLTMTARLSRAGLKNWLKDYIRDPNMHKAVGASKVDCPLHLSFLDFIQNRDTFPLPVSVEELYQNYTFFTFSRNPYDRMYSFYLQFEHVVKRIFKEDASFLPIEKWYEDPKFIYIRKLVNVPLHEYVNDPTDLEQPEFIIGRVENYEDDICRIFDKIGIPSTDISINIRNPPPVTGYKYLCEYDQEALDFVNREYAKDFSRFGYRKIENAEDIPKYKNLPTYE